MIKINESLYVPAAPFGFSPRFPDGKKGYLQKRGHYIKNWRMRFFVLEKTTLIENVVEKSSLNKNFVLNYYIDEKCNKLKGSYIINEDTILETLQEFDGKANVLTVTSLKASGEIESMHLSTGTEEERLQWFNALKEAIHGGFRSIVMSDLSSSSFFPKFNLVVKYRKTIDSITNDVAVNDGNIILARELQLRPKISYDCNVGYFTLLLVDMDSPARAASDRRFCIHWALVNVCQSDKSAIKEVSPYLPPAPFFGTGLHRYIFLLFQQPDVFDEAEVESSANWFTPNDGFPFPQWKASMGYTYPLGVNGFYAEWDDCCDDYQKAAKVVPQEQYMSPRQLAAFLNPHGPDAQQVLYSPASEEENEEGEEEADNNRNSENEDEEEDDEEATPSAAVSKLSHSEPTPSPPIPTPAATSAASIPATTTITTTAAAVAPPAPTTTVSASRSRLSKRSRAVVGLKRDKIVAKSAADSAASSSTSTTTKVISSNNDNNSDDVPEDGDVISSLQKMSLTSTKLVNHVIEEADEEEGEEEEQEKEADQQLPVVAGSASSRRPPPPPPPRKPIASKPIDNYLANLKTSSDENDATKQKAKKFALPFDPEKRFKKLHLEIRKKSVMWEPALKAFLDDDN